MNATIEAVTSRIVQRSRESRSGYLERLRHAIDDGPQRRHLGCTNLAHGMAASGEDVLSLRALKAPNIGIVSAYNDMLSAHQPLDSFPAIIRREARTAGATAQFAGGVPAMCDGVTQGRAGMELSLFSRDIIAMSTAIALSHDMFDAALCLGVCDKIVPGLLIGALSFGHLPVIFVPAGPMSSGLANEEKSRIRKAYAAGQIGRDELLAAETRAYHGPGTCTFYGTANSNQMLMEVMGLHLPGAAFVHPHTPLREALTAAATRQVLRLTRAGEHYTPIGEIIDERAIVNGIVGLLATGGSTNHTMHLVAIARAAGIVINWDDFDALSAVVPLLTQIYPNGPADVNHFHAAGGMGFLIGQLLDAGLLHAQVRTVVGDGLQLYREEPYETEAELAWRPAPAHSGDTTVLRPHTDAFAPSGGLRLVAGKLGRAVIKISAVPEKARLIQAPARCFADQTEVIEAFSQGRLDQDCVVVVRFQGPRANGMPELHQLTPQLSILQDRGFKVALVTDGRMSGASGRIPAAIHVTPEAAAGGALAKLQDDDLILLDAEKGILEVLVDDAVWAARQPANWDASGSAWGTGRELMAGLRAGVLGAEQGAISWTAGAAKHG